ncbi:LAGLIDADG family homing endonuclease [Priestia sp. YIM B13551]|uniref:LAGLIDADG family homing endonuclease n=1 Tax=Priestia sp. YIM B13551 TaxID=3366306 RepID=UPI003671DB47
MVKSINEEFFDTWTEESAYVLGYIWADGCLTKNKNNYRVSFCSNDKEIVEKINRVMKSEYAISEYKGSYSTGFSKPRMIKKLRSFGLIERKSLDKKFPVGIPSEFLRHFVRGYFDGNGYFTYEAWKNGKRRLISGFATGSGVFAEQLSGVVHELGMKHANVQHIDRRKSGRGQYYQMRYYQRDTVKLADVMYKDATIYMERKKKLYEECSFAKAGEKALAFLFVLTVRKREVGSILLRKIRRVVTVWHENRNGGRGDFVEV